MLKHVTFKKKHEHNVFRDHCFRGTLKKETKRKHLKKMIGAKTKN